MTTRGQYSSFQTHMWTWTRSELGIESLYGLRFWHIFHHQKCASRNLFLASLGEVQYRPMEANGGLITLNNVPNNTLTCRLTPSVACDRPPRSPPWICGTRKGWGSEPQRFPWQRGQKFHCVKWCRGVSDANSRRAPQRTMRWHSGKAALTFGQRATEKKLVKRYS